MEIACDASVGLEMETEDDWGIEGRTPGTAFRRRFTEKCLLPGTKLFRGTFGTDRTGAPRVGIEPTEPERPNPKS